MEDEPLAMPEDKRRIEQRELELAEIERRLTKSAMRHLIEAHARDLSVLPEHPLYDQALLWLERETDAPG